MFLSPARAMKREARLLSYPIPAQGTTTYQAGDREDGVQADRVCGSGSHSDRLFVMSRWFYPKRVMLLGLVELQGATHGRDLFPKIRNPKLSTSVIRSLNRSWIRLL